MVNTEVENIGQPNRTARKTKEKPNEQEPSKMKQRTELSHA
jgi:hypothetical protein